MGEWREPTRRADTVVRADPTATARSLTERLSRLRPGASAVAGSPFASAWLEADAAVRAAIDEHLSELDELSEPGVWTALGEALRDGDSVFAASSMPVRDLEAFLRPGPEGVRFAANRGANGIDGLVSTAAGLATGSAARTWAVLGDLALFHDLGGLAAARHAADLRLIVIDNSGGGIFHFLPQAEAMPQAEFEALLGTPSGLDPAAAAHALRDRRGSPAGSRGPRSRPRRRRQDDRRPHRPGTEPGAPPGAQPASSGSSASNLSSDS